jgi:hypothetical protein
MDNNVTFFDKENELAKKIIQKNAPVTCRNQMNIIHIFRSISEFDFGFIITNPLMGSIGNDHRDYDLISFILCKSEGNLKKIHGLLGCVSLEYKNKCKSMFNELLTYSIRYRFNKISLHVSSENIKLIEYYKTMGFEIIIPDDPILYMEKDI